MDATEEKNASEVRDGAPLEPVPGNSPMASERELSLVGLAQEIRDEFGLWRASAITNVGHAIRIGELLTKVRKKIPHGGWEAWVKTQCPFSPRQASKYLRYFELRDEITNRNRGSDLGLNAALALIADARQEKPDELENVLAGESQPEHEQDDEKRIESQPEHEQAAEDESLQRQAAPTPRAPVDFELIPPTPGVSPQPADPRPEISDAVPVPHPQKRTGASTEPKGGEEQLERSKLQEFYEPIVAIIRLLEDYADRGWATRQQGKRIIDTLRGLLKKARQIERGRTKPKAKSELRGQLDILDKLDLNECDKTEDRLAQS